MSTAIAPSDTVHEVTVTPAGMVYAANGALLGDVEGMERLGWEFRA